MSVSLRISIQDNATPALAEKMAKCDLDRLRNILGPGLTVFTQDHLRANGTNRRGWPTTNFWARAARATSWTAYGAVGGLMITINQVGVRQRMLGGPIAPVKAKALAIPISPVSYGHVPADFPALFLLRTPKGAYLVQRGQQLSEKTGRVVGSKSRAGNAGRRLKAELNFLFKLSAGVNQQPDPGVVPSGDQLAEVGLTLIERAVK